MQQVAGVEVDDQIGLQRPGLFVNQERLGLLCLRRCKCIQSYIAQALAEQRFGIRGRARGGLLGVGFNGWHRRWQRGWRWRSLGHRRHAGNEHREVNLAGVAGSGFIGGRRNGRKGKALFVVVRVCRRLAFIFKRRIGETDFGWRRGGGLRWGGGAAATQLREARQDFRVRAIFRLQPFKRVLGDFEVALHNVEIDAFQLVAQDAAHRVRGQLVVGVEQQLGWPLAGLCVGLADERVAVAKTLRLGKRRQRAI